MTFKCGIDNCLNTIELTDRVSPVFKYVCKNHTREQQVKQVREYDPEFDNSDSQVSFQDSQFFPEENFSNLRTNSSDPKEINRGYQILSPLQHDEIIPEWAKKDESIRNLLLLAFPKLHTNNKKRYLASLWAQFIYLYFRMRYTEGQIAEDMGLSLAQIKNIRISVYNVSQGLTNRGKPRKARKSKNPKRYYRNRE